MDQLLHTTKGPQPNTVLWRPQEGSSVVLKETDYRPFSYVARTVHLPDALAICAEHGMAPKPIVSTSTLNAKALSWQNDHPCRNLRVLWFGTSDDGKDEDTHDWYGNVEFAVPIDVMMKRWENFYFVEMVTARTHTATRILVTNSDYSSVLPRYDPRTPGGPWRLTPDGRHQRLVDCRRFNNNGYNKHGHTLEFMIEVTECGMKNILDEVTISFKNHQLGRSEGSHNCHRFEPPSCPTPYTRDVASKVFFKKHHRLNAHQPMATPRLSPSAEVLQQNFLAEEKMSTRALQVAPPTPMLSNHYPHRVEPPGQGYFICRESIQERLQDGSLANREIIIGLGEKKMFRIITESVRMLVIQDGEMDARALNLRQQRHPRMPPPRMPLAPPPGLPPFSPPMFPPRIPLPRGPPRLAPPPNVFHPQMLHHNIRPLQPTSVRRRH